MVARDVPFLPRDEFWAVVEDCRRRSADSVAFGEVVTATLAGWDFRRMAAFHNTLWYDVGVFHRGRLWDVMCAIDETLGSQNSWERYGGWLVAQGREFHEAVMRDPELARTRLPDEAALSDEGIIFAAQEACLRKTDRKHDLYDVLGDYLPEDAYSRR